jgi:hypothetical protein
MDKAREKAFVCAVNYDLPGPLRCPGFDSCLKLFVRHVETSFFWEGPQKVPRVCPTMRLSACFTGYTLDILPKQLNSLFFLFQSPRLFMLDSASVGIKSFLTRAPVSSTNSFLGLPL